MFWVDGARPGIGGLKCLATYLLALLSSGRSSSAAVIAANADIHQPICRLACSASNSSLLCSRHKVGGYVRNGNVLQGLIRLKRRRTARFEGAVPTGRIRRRHRRPEGGVEPSTTILSRTKKAGATAEGKANTKEREKQKANKKTTSPLFPTGLFTPPANFRSRLRRTPPRHRRRRPRRANRGRWAPGRKATAFRPRDLPSLLKNVWRTLVLLDGCCEATWVGKASAHVLAGALASSHSVMASLVVGLALWVSCAKRLTGRTKDDWKQVARITIEVALLWYCHALPHGLGAGRPLRGNFGTGKAGDLLGAMWHFLGQGAFIRLVAASGRLVNLNVLEANGVLLGLSHLGNALAGSRMRRIIGATGVSAAMAAVGEAHNHTYQLRGFFSRTNGIFRDVPFLSLPFDSADTLLALQGILSATEREVVQKNGELALAFRDFASQSGNTLDAHSLGAVGARNLMGMGFISARVRMFGRPALSLGWTEKANNMCMVGDPICGSLLQKLLDPTCVMLKGRGHVYDAYVACAS